MHGFEATNRRAGLNALTVYPQDGVALRVEV